MSVVNEFEVETVKYSVAEHKVYLRDQSIPDYSFPFSFLCSTTHTKPKVWVFFDFNSGKALLVMDNNYFSGTRYKCYVFRFWVEDDLPVFSAHVFDNQAHFIKDIAQSFKDSYAAYTLDNIINS